MSVWEKTEDLQCVAVKTKHEIRTLRHSGFLRITTKMQYKGKSAQRFISNATTNGVEATDNRSVPHKAPPPLNPQVDRDIDIHTCDDIKDCVCVYRMSNSYLLQRSDSCRLKRHSCLILLLNNLSSTLHFKFPFFALLCPLFPPFSFHILLSASFLPTHFFYLYFSFH